MIGTQALPTNGNGKTRIKKNPRCPACTSDNTTLLDSRSNGEGLTGRLYKCNRCTRQFSTLVREEIEPQVPGQHTTYSMLNAQHASEATQKKRDLQKASTKLR
jgi:transcriptional regulator NrdR family protein